MAEVEARFLGKDGLRDFWFTGRRRMSIQWPTWSEVG